MKESDWRALAVVSGAAAVFLGWKWRQAETSLASCQAYGRGVTAPTQQPTTPLQDDDGFSRRRRRAHRTY